MNSLIDESPRDSLETFLEMCERVLGVNAEPLRAIATTTIRYLSSDAQGRQTLRINQELEKRWYASLDAHSPDWHVYDADEYLAELWACWMVYSRRYLRDLRRLAVLARFGEVKSVVDLGCGFGYTTAAWRQMYPQASVYGTNLENTAQMRLARHVAQQYDFSMVSRLDDIAAPVDVLFASEYFEHFEAPIEHLDEVVLLLRPKVMIIANAFGAKAIGHFPQYVVNNVAEDGKHTSRAFHTRMRLRLRERTGRALQQPTADLAKVKS